MLNPKIFHDIVGGRRRGIGAKLATTVLAAASYPYAAGVYLRNRRFDIAHGAVQRVEVPVISVGNLTLGGTGKTPMIAWLAKTLRRDGHRPAIVSRGYGAADGKQNDEALELEQQLRDVPHLQNPDRVAAAKVAIEELESELILLDDGFQHRRLHRDLDIVLLDGTAPFGHERIFPRGTLREPITAMARAGAVVLTRADMISVEQRDWIRRRVQKFAPQATFCLARHAPTEFISASSATRAIAALRDQRVAAFCGIGNPAGFARTLRSISIDVVDVMEFADHHQYDQADLKSIDRWASEKQIDALVCTRKDLVKIGSDAIDGRPLWALGIEMELLEGEEALFEQVSAVIASAMR